MQQVQMYVIYTKVVNIHASSTCMYYIQLYGHTPLHVACLYDQQKVVLELLKKMESSPKLVNQPDNVS